MNRESIATLLVLIVACDPPLSPEARTWNEQVDAHRSRWEPRLGERVTMKGEAGNAKLGALLGELWIADFQAWPDDVRGKRVRAVGTLIFRDDLPVFPRGNYAAGGPVPAGIGMPEGADLEKSRRRYLLEKVEWNRLDP
jgi:hypothetical protein